MVDPNLSFNILHWYFHLSVPRRDDLRDDGERNLLRRARAKVEADWPAQTSDMRLTDAFRQESFAPPGLRLTTAERADIKRRAGQRDFERRVIKLGIVRERRDGGRARKVDLLQRFIRPGLDEPIHARGRETGFA